MFISSILFSVGGIITSQALSLRIFLLGRAISGAGGAGIMTIAIILVLELSSKKKRGIFIGLVNAGFTSGVSLGAVIAGALLPMTGWVRLIIKAQELHNTDKLPEIFVLDSKSLCIVGRDWALSQHSKVIPFRKT
jgi:MFS family permease